MDKEGFVSFGERGLVSVLHWTRGGIMLGRGMLLKKLFVFASCVHACLVG